MHDQTNSSTYAIVLNGAAGALVDGSQSSETLQSLFEDGGLRPILIPPDAGTLPERIRMACRSGAATVVVAGGDGTVACAAAITANEGVTLGILPFGTMNLLAKDLGIPVGDTKAAVALLKAGYVRIVDAVEVNGHLFACASMIGLPARLARYREATRGQGFVPRLWLRFVRAILRGLASYGAPRLTVRIDGRLQRLRAASLTITVNPLADTSGRLFGRTQLDGGVLGVYAVRRANLSNVVRMLVRAMIGHWRDDPELSGTTAHEIDIIRMGNRRTIRAMNDGEVTLMEPPLRYRIRPGALRVIAAPPEA